MPEIGRDDREYWLKMLMGLAVEANRISKNLYEEQQIADDGSVRENKMQLYRFECECTTRNTLMITAAAMSPNQRKLMKLRYVKKKPWTEIAGLMQTTRRYTYRIHERALKRVCTSNTVADFKAAYTADKARLDEMNHYLREYE